jgi:hypothetical protein
MWFQEDDFYLRHPVEIAKAGAESQRIMTLLLGNIASVAVVVAVGTLPESA